MLYCKYEGTDNYEAPDGDLPCIQGLNSVGNFGFSNQVNVENVQLCVLIQSTPMLCEFVVFVLDRIIDILFGLCGLR